jgi:hypothetical protein
MAKDTERSEWVRVTLRIPPELHHELSERAEENLRSINNEILILLRRYMHTKETLERENDEKAG